MATQAELQAVADRLTQKVTDLEAASAAEKAQVAEGFANTNTTIADLKAQIEALQAGATISQSTIDQLSASADKVEAQIAAVSDIFTPTP